MVAATTKRQSDARHGAQRHAKRQRVERAQKANATEAANDGADPAPPQTVRLDQLQWKEVSIPDCLEDVEGFFGLEEIEDVEIIQTGERGQVEYRLATKEPPKDRTVAVKKTNSGPVKDTTGDEPEWEGFADDDLKPTEPASSIREKKKGKTGAKQDKKRSKKEPAVGSTSKTPVNAFAGLEDEALDDKDVDVSAWKPLGISADVLASISKLGFSKPTPIQSASIPEILAGHDVVGKASTGSGKTLAFGIPILEHFRTLKKTHRARKKAAEAVREAPSALILSPTRELAHQLSSHLTALCSNYTADGPSIATITGGLSLQKQQRQLSTADIVIGTPGRLWEIISAGHGVVDWLRKVKFLVVDEADRLLSEGHFKEFEEILNVLDQDGGEDNTSEEGGDKTGASRERQTLVFSATFHKDLQQKLSGKGRPGGGGDLLDQKSSMQYLLKKLNFREEKPKFIDVNPVSQMADNLKEGLVECAALEKDLYLYALLLHHPQARTLIFTNSISSVRRLTPLLQNLSLPAASLHSQMAQKARLRAIERFSSSSTKSTHRILISTDVAARGLDIPSIDLIVHYHLPRSADTYVHRSGRTARSTQAGTSIVLCAPSEAQGLRRLVAKVHSRHLLRTLDLDRRLVARLKPRVTLAKTIADALLAKEKGSKEDTWLREAADDLGVDWDSESMEVGAQGVGRKGRGTGRVKREQAARALSKSEVGALKAELKALLAERVNTGVSERYLTAGGEGGVDIDALLREREGGEEAARGAFLGTVNGVGFAG